MYQVKVFVFAAISLVIVILAANLNDKIEPDFTDAYRECMSNSVTIKKMSVESAGVTCRREHQSRRADWLKAHPAGRLNTVNN